MQQASVPSVQCSVLSAQCPVPSAQCSVLGARCSVSVLSAQCSVLGARCSVLRVAWRDRGTSLIHTPHPHPHPTFTLTLTQASVARREATGALAKANAPHGTPGYLSPAATREPVRKG